MPKKVYLDFSGGLSIKDKNIPDNQFFIGEKLDIFRNDGYIMPSPAYTDFDSSSLRLRGTPISSAVDSTNSKIYIMAKGTSVGDLYQITLNSIFNSNFDGSSHYYKNIGDFQTGSYNGSFANSMEIYACNDTAGTPINSNQLVYTYNTSSKAYLGRYPLTGTTFFHTYNDLTYGNSYMSPHPTLKWQTYLWIGNGQYLAKFDGATGSGGTLNSTALNLGNGWEITALFQTNNYIGICAWEKGTNIVYTESKVFFWDGVSQTFNYSIPIKDNKITGAINYNGIIYLCTTGRNATNYIGILRENGYEPIIRQYLIINGSLTGLAGGTFNTMSICQNKLFIGERESRAAVFSIGSEFKVNQTLTFPFLLSTNANDFIGFVKQVGSNNIYIGWRDATNAKNYLFTFNPFDTSYGTATYKAGYFDLGQKIVINNMEIFFKPLVSGDSITIGIDTDYGTSHTPQQDSGIISYTKDGTITYKKFDFGGVECHAFRPTISWSGGGVAVSKIIIDYSFIDN